MNKSLCLTVEAPLKSHYLNLAKKSLCHWFCLKAKHNNEGIVSCYMVKITNVVSHWDVNMYLDLKFQKSMFFVATK